MSKKKSLVANFANLSEGNAQTDVAAKPVKRMAAGVIGATHKTLTELREERDRLQEQLSASGAALIEIETELIDPSPYKDRLPDDDDEAYESFKQTIANEGQKTPITVRVHPAKADRYQVIFGHRRLRAAKDLGINVIAQIAAYSDRELIIAQGIENAARQDLSWIEKALFSNEMQQAGIKAKDIKAALAVDDAQMSKYRAVLKVLPVTIIERIGRSPTIGRPRWMELAEAITGEDDLLLIDQTLSSDKVSGLASDQKFTAVLAVLKAKLKAKKEDRKTSDGVVDVAGLGKARLADGRVEIIVATADGDLFRRFMAAELADIAARFLTFKETNKN